MSLAKIKSLAKDSAVYGAASIISRMLTFFLVPVYTRIFHPADFGIINLLNVTFFLISILSVCALDNAAARWFYDTNDLEDRKKTIASWFWFQLTLSVFLAVALALLLPLFARYVIKIPSTALRGVWWLCCGTLITNILPTVIWNWYRLNRKPKATVIFTLSQASTTIALTIWFVVFLKWHIAGVFAALFISGFLFSILAAVQMHNWLHFHFVDRLRLNEMLRFSLPMIPAALAFWLINSTDAYFIQYFRDTAEVGLFSVGASLASAVTLVTGAFQQAWGPFAFSIANEFDAKQTYANVFLAFGAMSGFLVLGMFLFSPEFLQWFTTPQYYGSAWVASILSINVVLIAFTYIAAIGTSIAKNTVHYSAGILIAAILTVMLDVLLIPKWGKEGSAIATVLAQLIVPVYLFYWAQKLYPVPYDFGKVIMLLSFAVLLGIMGRALSLADPVASIGFKTIFLFAYITFGFFYLKPVLNKFRASVKISSS